MGFCGYSIPPKVSSFCISRILHVRLHFQSGNYIYICICIANQINILQTTLPTLPACTHHTRLTPFSRQRTKPSSPILSSSSSIYPFPVPARSTAHLPSDLKHGARMKLRNETPVRNAGFPAGSVDAGEGETHESWECKGKASGWFWEFDAGACGERC
jgi:hypothetical protein